VVGETIRIDGRAYTIVGLFTEMGDSEGNSLDSMVFIPFSIAQRTFRNTTISTFYASAASGEDADIDRAVATLKTFMLNKTGDEDYYSVTSQSQLLETMGQVANTLSLMLAGIAGISLGRRHRHHEHHAGFGLRAYPRDRHSQAIGAQKLDIMLQFLIEAVFDLF
jgi:putative ABC transport system permease protein